MLPVSFTQRFVYPTNSATMALSHVQFKRSYANPLKSTCGLHSVAVDWEFCAAALFICQTRFRLALFLWYVPGFESEFWWTVSKKMLLSLLPLVPAEGMFCVFSLEIVCFHIKDYNFIFWTLLLIFGYNLWWVGWRGLEKNDNRERLRGRGGGSCKDKIDALGRLLYAISIALYLCDFFFNYFWIS